MTENYHNAKLSSLKRSANINENITDDELLEAILKPREWDHDSKHYIQYVSHNAASREDVVNLQKILDERLNTRQAKFYNIKRKKKFMMILKNKRIFIVVLFNYSYFF